MDLGFIISDETAVLASGIVLTLALVLALAASKRRTGSLLTPITVFLVFAYVHVLFGRYTAFLTTRYTFLGPATLEPFINQSFFIVATGLTCCCVSYAVMPFFRPSSIALALSRISSREAFDQVCARSRLLILVSVPLILFGLSQLGGIPLFSDNMRQDRYLLNFLPEYRLATFLVNRGREMIVIPAAVLGLGWFFGRRRIVDLLFVGISAISCLLTATRAPILAGVLIVLVVLVCRGKAASVMFTIVAIAAGLIVSEIALGDAGPSATGDTAIERVGADIGEVRDLGWFLMKDDQRYWGLTFLAGLLPIPSFASDFTETYHLRTLTLNAIGISLTAAHGGLRITYSGEWYLNFGWPGVIFGGLLYGWLCSRFSRIFHILQITSESYPVGMCMLACAWVACSFMVYLSGSAVGGTLKTYSAVVFVLCIGLPQSAYRQASLSRRTSASNIEWQQPAINT